MRHDLRIREGYHNHFDVIDFDIWIRPGGPTIEWTMEEDDQVPIDQVDHESMWRCSRKSSFRDLYLRGKVFSPRVELNTTIQKLSLHP